MFNVVHVEEHGKPADRLRRLAGHRHEWVHRLEALHQYDIGPGDELRAEIEYAGDDALPPSFAQRLIDRRRQPHGDWARPEPAQAFLVATDCVRFAALIARYQKQAVDAISYLDQGLDVCSQPLAGAVYSFGVVGIEA